MVIVVVLMFLVVVERGKIVYYQQTYMKLINGMIPVLDTRTSPR